MPRYLVAIHLPDNFDPATMEDEAMHRDIDVLNQEMIDAGARLFVCGLQPVATAQSLHPAQDGNVSVSKKPYMRGSEHIGGFWVLEAADIDAALEWGRKAVLACRVPVEVRPLMEM